MALVLLEAGGPIWAGEADVSEYTAFEMSLKEGVQSQVLSLGKTIFEKLEKKYPANGELRLLRSRMAAAEYVAGQMEAELNKAKERELKSVAGELFADRGGNEEQNAPIVPARDFYEASMQLFVAAAAMEDFGAEEKAFLWQYYSAKIKALVDSVANAGKALSITDEHFTGMYDYVLVLPLLHASEQTENVEMLPDWMRGDEHFSALSESCLLHYGLPFHSMIFARKSAQNKGGTFSEIEFYESAANRCGDSRPQTAAKCLDRAIDLLSPGETDKIMSLRLQAAQLWLDSGKYNEAAVEARKASETYPESTLAGKAIWLHYYALSKTDDTSGLLGPIDGAISDMRCAEYRAKLMYMKWYALRRKLATGPAVVTLENELLSEYGSDPIVAPIMLFKANDLMARQDYENGCELFSSIVEKFPSSEAAAQAAKMMTKLKGRR
jgi:TolA-binding protein